MDQNSPKDVKHNITMNLFDGAFFGLAIGFVSFTTILPLFVSTMTDSAILIGLVPAIHNTGWQLPQLFTSKKVSSLAVLKPMVLISTVHERLPFLVLALVAWFLPSIGTTAGLILTLLALTWQGLGAGMAANPWQNMIGKIIPSDFLATFFGLQSAVANLLASLGALCAGFFLDRISGSRGFAVSFLSASLLMVVSWFFLRQTREPASIRSAGENRDIPIRESITRVFKENKPFVWFLGSRMLFYLGMMAFAFFMVYAVRKLNMSEIEAGILTSVLLITQTAANIILGRLADRWSRKGTIELGALACAASCLLAWYAPSTAWFYPVIILQGIANTAFWTIGFPILLEFGSEEQRPMYVGLGNTLIAPVAILSPILGGMLADTAGYPVTFLVSAVLSGAAVLVLHFFVSDPRPRTRSVPATYADTP